MQFTDRGTEGKDVICRCRLLEQFLSTLSYLVSVCVQGQRKRGLQVSSKASVKVWWGWLLDRQVVSWTWPAAPSRAFRGIVTATFQQNFIFSLSVIFFTCSLFPVFCSMKNFLCHVFVVISLVCSLIFILCFVFSFCVAVAGSFILFYFVSILH